MYKLMLISLGIINIVVVLCIVAQCLKEETCNDPWEGFKDTKTQIYSKAIKEACSERNNSHRKELQWWL